MNPILGQTNGGRLLGGLLVPRGVIVGGWRSRDDALALLAAGLTKRVVIPAGGTATAALAAGFGADEVEIGPAHIAVRLQGAHPDQARSEDPWLRQTLAAELMHPTMDDVHWVAPDRGPVETWVPVRAIERRSYRRRRRSCVF